MRISIIILISVLFVNCKKGTNYCNPPQKVNGFANVAPSYDPNSPIQLNLDFLFDYSQETHETTTLFTFTVPSIFENPKGDDRPVDTVENPTYTYIVKDPANVPDSVVVEGYAFNDCGKSEVATAVIHFN